MPAAVALAQAMTIVDYTVIAIIVAMAIDIALAESTMVLLVFIHTKKEKSK